MTLASSLNTECTDHPNWSFSVFKSVEGGDTLFKAKGIHIPLKGDAAFHARK